MWWSLMLYPETTQSRLTGPPGFASAELGCVKVIAAVEPGKERRENYKGIDTSDQPDGGHPLPSLVSDYSQCSALQARSGNNVHTEALASLKKPKPTLYQTLLTWHKAPHKNGNTAEQQHAG